MNNTAIDELKIQTADEISTLYEESTPTEAELVEFKRENTEHDFLYENFINNLDAWVRHPLARNRYW